MHSTIAKRIMAKTSKATKAKVKAYGHQKVENFQPSLFGFVQPRTFRISKIISKERMLEGKALLAKGDTRGAVEILRDARYKLEDFLKRINNAPTGKNLSQ